MKGKTVYRVVYEGLAEGYRIDKCWEEFSGPPNRYSIFRTWKAAYNQAVKNAVSDTYLVNDALEETENLSQEICEGWFVDRNS